MGKSWAIIWTVLLQMSFYKIAVCRNMSLHFDMCNCVLEENQIELMLKGPIIPWHLDAEPKSEWSIGPGILILLHNTLDFLANKEFKIYFYHIIQACHERVIMHSNICWQLFANVWIFAKLLCPFQNTAMSAKAYSESDWSDSKLRVSHIREYHRYIENSKLCQETDMDCLNLFNSKM